MDLSNFDGIARLFPLPNLVVFPQVLQPLHIFEPRYRQMTADALAGDRLIAMALLRPGWEGDYEGRPELYPVVCLGRIITDQKLDDGRYNILLRGLERARVVQEVEPAQLYRQARVEILRETSAPDSAWKLRRQLGEQALPWFPAQGPAAVHLEKLLKSDLPLGVVCDLIAFALPLAVELKQSLLEELDVEKRARLLLRHLEETDAGRASGASQAGPFPPPFSEN